MAAMFSPRKPAAPPEPDKEKEKELQTAELDRLAAKVVELLEPKITDIMTKALEPVLSRDHRHSEASGSQVAERVVSFDSAVSTRKAGMWKEWTKRHWRTFNVAMLAEQEEELLQEENHLYGPLDLEPAEEDSLPQNEDPSYRILLTQPGGAAVNLGDVQIGENDLEAEPLDRDCRSSKRGPRGAASRLTLSLASNYRRVAHSSCQSVWLSAERLVMSAWFEHLVGFVVMANAVAIGVETDFQARTGQSPPGFATLSLVFSVCFTLELLLRFVVNPFRFLDCHHRDNFLWNIFDILVVGFQLVESLDGDQKLLSSFGLLRFCRIFRILRLVRVVRFFAELRMLLSSMIASIESLCWALMLLFGIVFTFATAFCQIVTETGFVSAHGVEFRKWFGSLGWSTLTLLQCITGGVSWSDIINALISDIGVFSGILLVLYIGTCLFAVTNAVTGVFVAKITTVAVQDKVTYLTHQLREIFFKKGSPNPDEEFVTIELFKEKVHEKAMQDFFKSIDVDKEEHEAFFSLLDIDGNGQLTVDELVNGCLRLTGPAQALDIAVLMRQNNELLELLDSGTAQAKTKRAVTRKSQVPSHGRA